MLKRGGQYQKWPTSGQIGYITPSIHLFATLQSGGIILRMAHSWADWQHYSSHLGGPQSFKAGDNFKNGPQVGRLAT